MCLSDRVLHLVGLRERGEKNLRLLAREVVRCVDRLGPAMPADNANGARLRALYPLLFGESDLGADL